MNKNLVTGCDGFKGRHMVKRLLERGEDVHCLDSVVPLTGRLIPDHWPFFNPLDYEKFHWHNEDCITRGVATFEKINKGATVNLSTGRFTSFIEFTRQAPKLVGYSPEVIEQARNQMGILENKRLSILPI